MLHQTSTRLLNSFFHHQHHFSFTKPIPRFPFSLPKVLSMATSHSNQHNFTNRLASEQSPYLLQHAHNPVSFPNFNFSIFQFHLVLTDSFIPFQVDWYPWGDEAFAEARRRDAPIFLSSNSLPFLFENLSFLI